MRDLQKRIHKNAVEKGFWDHHIDTTLNMEILEETENGPSAKQNYLNSISTMLMLIVSEAGEALEALRTGDHDNFKEELADIVIRCLDLAEGLDIDLEVEVKRKMKKNESRSRKHGKRF